MQDSNLKKLNTTRIRIMFALSMFFTGAAGLVNEYVLSTVSSYILGNTIEQFSVTIALMLGAMGAGGWIQKYFNDEDLVYKFLKLELTLALLGGFAPIVMYAAFGYLPVHFALIQYFFIISIGLLIGFEIPFLIRINENFSDSLKGNVSLILAADYLGSLVGAYVWVYLLLPYVHLVEISFILSGLNLMIAVMTILVIERSTRTVVPAVIVTAIMLMGYTQVKDWSVALEQKLYPDKIIYSQKTKYQKLTVTQDKDMSEIRLYINGNTQFASRDEHRYHDNLVSPIMALVKGEKSALVFGGGDGMAVRDLKKNPMIKDISLIDLDEGMIKLFKTEKVLTDLNENAFENVNFIKPEFVIDTNDTKTLFRKGEEIGTVNVVNIDADKFLHSIIGKGKKWDIIIIDFPDPSNVDLAKLYSKEFYLKVKMVLKKGGMFVVQSTSPYHAKESFLTIGRTIEAAGFDTLPYHDNVPAFGDWGWWVAWNKNDMTKAEVFAKIENIEFETDTNYLTESKFRSNFFFGRGELTSKYTDINTLMRPVLLQRYIKDSWKTY